MGPAYANVSLSVEMQGGQLVSSITNVPQLAKAMNLSSVKVLRERLFQMGGVELSSSDMFGAGYSEQERSVLMNDPSKVMRFVFEDQSTTPPTPLLFRGMSMDNYLALMSNIDWDTDESSRNETYRNEYMTGRYHIAIYNSKTKKTTNLAPIAALRNAASKVKGANGLYMPKMSKMQVDFYKSPSIRHEPFSWTPKRNNKHLTFTVSYH